MRPLWLSFMLVIVSHAAPVAAQDGPEKLAITAIIDAPEEVRDRVRRGTRDAGLPVEVTVASLPQADTVVGPDRALLEALVVARQAYVSAEFDVCLAGLADDSRLHEHLARGERGLVARAFFWRVACRVGAGDAAGATRQARRFAVLGLEVPSDAEAATPEVEAALAAAMRDVEGAPRAGCAVTANARATVSVDGRWPGCETPCTLDLPHGNHVVRVAADGFVPAWRLARVNEEGARVVIELEDAPPDLAARQWAERWTGHPGVESAASVELLARATRARRLVLVRAEAEGGRTRLSGVLAVEGRVAARASRSEEDVERATRELLRELLVEGGVMEPAPSLLESPWLWIAVGVAALGAAAITGALLYQPETRTEVGF